MNTCETAKRCWAWFWLVFFGGSSALGHKINRHRKFFLTDIYIKVFVNLRGSKSHSVSSEHDPNSLSYAERTHACVYQALVCLPRTFCVYIFVARDAVSVTAHRYKRRLRRRSTRGRRGRRGGAGVAGVEVTRSLYETGERAGFQCRSAWGPGTRRRRRTRARAETDAASCDARHLYVGIYVTRLLG